MWMKTVLCYAFFVVAMPAISQADTAENSCTKTLTKMGVQWESVSRKGIDIGVSIAGPLGGVNYEQGDKQPLIVDCSLAISLAEAGPYLTALGITHARYSSAYSRRTVRGTNRLSKHSFGRAIDIHRFSSESLGVVRVDQDFEQGLGDAVDCIGAPLTEGGATLKIAQCQLAHSGLFSLVLSPDYDDAHHDHFHLEVIPWSERSELRSKNPAIF
jgi:hypothetical protein